ncbi:MAG: hypothetical protein MIK82_06200 [Pantoea piersonii]|jgi:hypothetical protein|nr:hypothetical protein [Pantoea piersonii]MDT0178510.1 hypothetical protein [Enterobacter sp. BRE11]MBZ6385966.1 hypothetical protein [Pantoea piersonii]MBZ6399437.1 hypothetical protein [Pantoea piersonii]MBZ6408040.1 hypothetical protein [Pantoea piersonii]MBZ6427037.1 hypothetical protein [Pantoea piersonii]
MIWAIPTAQIRSEVAVSTGWPASAVILTCSKTARGLILESKASVKRYLEEVPLTVDEKAIVENDAEKIDQALKRLAVKPGG